MRGWIFLAALLVAAPALAATPSFTAGWIERLPRIDYVPGVADPTVVGWPSPGQTVTWRAHVLNVSSQPLEGLRYRWLLDGAEVASGVADLPAGSGVTVDLVRPWERRRRLEIVLAKDGESRRLAVATDALAVAFYAERSVYDHFRRHQPGLEGLESTGFEDWAQRQIAAFNGLLERAVHPETPGGVRDRLRLDRVVVVPDGALPLDGSPKPLAANRPDRNDRSVDLQRGFPASILASQYRDLTARADNPFVLDGALIHELGHARALIDLYGFDVYHGVRGSRVEILEGEIPVAGGPWLPGEPTVHNGAVGLALHRTAEQGLMNTRYDFLDRYSAVVLERLAGRRPSHGNWNGSGDIGFFLDDLPRENRLTVRDDAGRPLPGARVSIYRAEGVAGDLYAKVFDNVPDLTLTADDHGRVLLGRNPFRSDGPVQFRPGRFTGVVIVRVEHEEAVGYGFLESLAFNLEHWRGRTEMGEHDLKVGLLPKKLTAGRPEEARPDREE